MRFAMGIATIILSFAIVEGSTGVPVHIQPADLCPVRIWSRAENEAIRVKDRALKSYENLRIVYQLERQLKDLQEQQEAAESRATDQGNERRQ
jgi:hypothetical protein